MYRPKANLPTEELRDLGFGTRVSQQSRLRLLNKDGSFNVSRTGLSFFNSLDPYQWLLNLSWPWFYLLVFAGYLLVNAVFAVAFVACGPDTLKGVVATGTFNRILEAFFFSV